MSATEKLLKAAEKGDVAAVKLLLADCDRAYQQLLADRERVYRDGLGRTALHKAAAGGHPAVIDALLCGRGRVETSRLLLTTDRYGFLPLHLAAYGGSQAAAERLLAPADARLRAAQLTARDVCGGTRMTPEEGARDRSHPALAIWLADQLRIATANCTAAEDGPPDLDLATSGVVVPAKVARDAQYSMLEQRLETCERENLELKKTVAEKQRSLDIATEKCEQLERKVLEHTASMENVTQCQEAMAEFTGRLAAVESALAATFSRSDPQNLAEFFDDVASLRQDMGDLGCVHGDRIDRLETRLEAVQAAVKDALLTSATEAPRSSLWEAVRSIHLRLDQMVAMVASPHSASVVNAPPPSNSDDRSGQQ